MLGKVFQRLLKYCDAAYNFIFYIPCGGEMSFRQKCLTFAELNDGDRVLDVCCGIGEMTKAIASQEVTTDLIGVDIYKLAIETACTKLLPSPTSFLRASADALPFKSSKFDKCFVSFGLHHMPESTRRKALTEVHRVLASDGNLYVIDYNLPKGRLRRLCALIYAKFDKSREAIIMLKSGSMVKEIKQAGFGISQRAVICQGLVQLLKVVKQPSLLEDFRTAASMSCGRG